MCNIARYMKEQPKQEIGLLCIAMKNIDKWN